MEKTKIYKAHVSGCLLILMLWGCFFVLDILIALYCVIKDYDDSTIDSFSTLSTVIETVCFAGLIIYLWKRDKQRVPVITITDNYLETHGYNNRKIFFKDVNRFSVKQELTDPERQGYVIDIALKNKRHHKINADGLSMKHGELSIVLNRKLNAWNLKASVIKRIITDLQANKQKQL